MRVIMDAHLHSRFSRATSQNMNVDELFRWAKYKGINLLGTGDFTHPFWLTELEEKLEEKGDGFLHYKGATSLSEPIFLLTVELSCIYSEKGKTRRIHLVVFVPSFSAAHQLNELLARRGNLYADGRPVFGWSAKELTKMILETVPEAIIVPAHIWTPWFSLFGSNSGFDSIEECFGELAERIYALETGLSSDPPMNWRLSALDHYALVSFSDAHSPSNLGREAVVFEVNAERFDYPLLVEMLKEGSPKFRQQNSRKPSYLDYTIEFFPEEGKYHFDGHRNCQVSLDPEESKKMNNLCPQCHRPLTIGVMHRVVDLADRPAGFAPEGAPSYRNLVPLNIIIAESLKQQPKSKTVFREYLNLVTQIAPELPLLLDVLPEDLQGKTAPEIVEGLKKVRAGEIEKVPGYDGVYGVIKLKEAKENSSLRQQSLF